MGRTPSYLCLGDFRGNISPHILHYHSHSILYSQNKQYSWSPMTCSLYWTPVDTVDTTFLLTRRHHRGTRPQHMEYTLQHRQLVQPSRVDKHHNQSCPPAVAHTQQNMVYMDRSYLGWKKNFPAGMRDTPCCRSCWRCTNQRDMAYTQSVQTQRRVPAWSLHHTDCRQRCRIQVIQARLRTASTRPQSLQVRRCEGHTSIVGYPLPGMRNMYSRDILYRPCWYPCMCSRHKVYTPRCLKGPYVHTPHRRDSRSTVYCCRYYSSLPGMKHTAGLRCAMSPQGISPNSPKYNRCSKHLP